MAPGIATRKIRSAPPAPDQVIERKGARAAAKQHQHHRGPLQVRRPGLRVDEDLDDRRHPEERCDGEARHEPEHEENRAGYFDRERHLRRELRRQERHAVLLGEELDRALPVDELHLRGIPEDHRDAQAQRDREQRVRNGLEPGDQLVQGLHRWKEVRRPLASASASHAGALSAALSASPPNGSPAQRRNRKS